MPQYRGSEAGSMLQALYLHSPIVKIPLSPDYPGLLMRHISLVDNASLSPELSTGDGTLDWEGLRRYRRCSWSHEDRFSPKPVQRIVNFKSNYGSTRQPTTPS